MSTQDNQGKFDPSEHLSKIGGKGGPSDYLQVKWRLVWFREDWPHGTIETEHIELTDQRAIFRATVRKVNAAGEVAGTATGYGSETPRDFGDFIEKAETKAIGRALAALGYGTQFAPELDEGERVVDSPVTRQPAAQRPQEAPKPASGAAQGAPASLSRERVMKRLHAVAAEQGISHDDLHLHAMEAGYASLTDVPVSRLVEWGQFIKDRPYGFREQLEAVKARQTDNEPPTTQSGLRIDLPPDEEARMRAARHTQI